MDIKITIDTGDILIEFNTLEITTCIRLSLTESITLHDNLADWIKTLIEIQ